MTAIGPNRSTGIEWTNHSWNPMVGCSILSAGCTNCYAMLQAAKIEGHGMSPAYKGTTKLVNGHPVWTGKLSRASDAKMRAPLSIREPSRIFVNSMSDFWHEDADDQWRLEALAIMREAERHQFQILTKRPENIEPFVERYRVKFPQNAWFGVTVERGDVKHRIATLNRVECSIRFVSFEPLIGALGDVDLTGIHWAIIGGESGPGARPMAPEWAREVRDLCVRQGVRLFFKQWGLYTNNPLAGAAPKGVSPYMWVKRNDPNGKGGSLLDGQEWKEYPR